ncbi:hypothetical protein G7Y89_g10828 [Cudoniella acicularis]|uniref:CNH domain-containing protein n=1 Tax=Cudoniella acicularis TaxID=354080 RepID=A0A8H4REQ0_9HELO|nr:hypothetical protein G7Y89_g10828 [Cudoniella acicularis]
MLSAFTARPLVELRQRDKFKIESILAYGDRLLVGLNTGSLRIYRVNETQEAKQKHNGSANSDDKPPSRPSSSAAPKPVDLLREVEKFSTRAIEQLARIKEANVLISLSASYVSIHDLQTYTLQEQLTKTKNATTFAVTSNIVQDSATGIPEIISRLAVAVKRRLLLWAWHESELEPDMVEITLAESIRTLTWASATKIICGMNSGYVIVDVLSQEVEDIVGPGAIGGAPGAPQGRFGGMGSASMGYMGLGGYIPKPLATKLADGEMLLSKDINSLFITSEGKPMTKRQIPWAQAPDAVGYTYPYIIALQAPAKGALEVRNPETLSLLQTISLPNASQLSFPPPTVSLAHAGKGFHVASDRCIWAMGATDYDSQVDELVEKGLYDEAITILDMLEDALLRNKQERLREIKIQKAQVLFDQRKYRDAIDIFLRKDVQAPPERVIRLYPRIIAGDLSIVEEKQPDAEVENEEGSEHANGESPGIEEVPPEVVGSPKPAAVSKLIKGHQKASSDTSSIRSFAKLDAADASDTASVKAKSTDDGPLEGKDLVTAALELNAFLVDARNRMKSSLDAETGKLVPKDKSKQNGQNGENGFGQGSFESFLTSPATDSEKDREEKLRETAKLIDTTLFRSYMLVRPQLVGALFRIPNFCDPDVVNEKLLEKGRYHDLVDFFHGKKLHRPALELLKKFGMAEEEEESAPTLYGPQRTVGYLQNLPPEMIDLILEFAEWPLRAKPDLTMEIFLGDTENAETLPRDKVVDFLQGIDLDLAVKYLEHVINELNDLTPDFHNQLVAAYLRDLKNRQDRDSDDWKDLMNRLVTFLRTSKQYSLGKAFGNIPRNDFYEAQAVVLSNMGQHKQALEIYVFKIQDFEKAEDYCNHVHLQSSTESSPLQSRKASTVEEDDATPPSIYHTLLSLYLTPPPPHSPNWPPALDLLSKHGSRLPASSTLSLIPTTLPVAELESYFQGRIRAANSVVNEARIVGGMRKTEVVNAQATLLLGDPMTGGKGGRNRGVFVSKERVCGVCHKRLGGSVIAVLPDNEVVHYGCLNRANGRPTSSGMESLRSASWRR